MTTTAIGTALAAGLLLAGCSNGDDGDAEAEAPEEQAGEESATENGAPEEEATEFTDLPVGEPFGEAAWGVDGIDFGPDSEQQPVVTADRVIAVEQGEVRAWDTEGVEAWSAPLPEGEGLGEGEDDLTLRQTSPDTVAVIASGESESEGLAEDGYAASVILFDAADGSTITETEVPEGRASSHNQINNFSRYGLAFALPEGPGVAITPDGQEHEVDDMITSLGEEGAGTTLETPIGTVGDVIIWATEDGAEPAYVTDTWSTSEIDEVGSLSGSSLQSVSQHGVVIIGSAGSDSVTVDAETGEVIDTLDCDPYFTTQLTPSPSGEWDVGGPLLIGGGEAQCIGGGEGEQSVELSAVSDDGTAYGTSEGDLVVVPTEGDEELTDLPEGADAPIGILEGDLAVHWDEEQGVINVNPVE